MDPTLNLQKAATPVIEKLNGWGLSAVKMLPNLVVALIVLVFSVLLAFVVGRVVHRMVERISPYGHVARLDRRHEPPDGHCSRGYPGPQRHEPG